MRKTVLHSLLIVMALMMPFVAGAQNQHCAITVADGTATNSYVPIYGFYCDDYLRCQILYPASLIQEAQFMTDVTHEQYSNIIRSMTFYLATPAAASWGDARFVLKIKEVPTSTNVIGSSYWDMSAGNATIAFSDSLNAMGETMLVHFTLGMQYLGGNLLVEIDNVEEGTYTSCSWQGISYAGASLSGYSSTSVEDCPANQRNFLPKTTFIFENTGLETGNGTAVTIGDEMQTSTTTSYPVSNSCKYSLSETILTASELGGAGTFRSISYKYQSSSRMTKKSDVSIWIQPTERSVFASNYDWEHLNPSTAVKVYQGPLNCNTGWNEFVFTTPYEYDGTGNLVVFVDDNSGSNDGGNFAFVDAPCSGKKTWVVYDNEENPDPTSATINVSSSGYMTAVTYRPMMRINKEDSQCGDALLCVDFHDGTQNGNYWSGTGYTTGVVTGTAEAHDQSGSYSYWHRIPNIEESTLSSLTSVYPYLAQSWGSYFVQNMQSIFNNANTSCDNGFMMMSMIEQRVLNTGNFNAYINLGVVDASQAPVVDVSFYQYYKKFYDHCYLDYRTSSNGTWYSMEINNELTANATTRGYYTVTLPFSVAGSSYLELRLRWFSDGSRSNAYGYYWVIDDVKVIAGDADRLKYGVNEYVQGGYGMIPQGMAIEPAWYGEVTNNGVNIQTNVTATLKHLGSNMLTETTLGSCNNGSVSPVSTERMILDPAGWLDPDNLDYAGWFGYARHTPHGNSSPLPTQTLGDHYLFTTLTTAAGLEHNFDTSSYLVTSFDNSLKAYRWGKDNSVLAYSPYNYYIYGWINVNNNWYVTDDEEDVAFNAEDYSVTLRYTTGSVIPDGWVIRGVELVASPQYAGVGSTIKPVLTKVVYDESGESFRFLDINPFCESHQITSGEVNDESVIGRNSNGYLEQGNYNTITMLFPEQPELEPFTSYYIGYKVVEGNDFAVARSYDYYRTASPTSPESYDTILYFRNNPATAKYGYPFRSNDWDVNVYDASNPNSSGNIAVVSQFKDYEAPMIRMLVGPAQATTRASIEVECYDSEYGSVYYMSEDACGTTVTPVEHTSPFFYINHYRGSVSIFLDGNPVDSSDLEYLDAEYIKYTMHDVTGTHRLRVVFDINGIDNTQLLTLNSKLKIHPNPASTMVTLSIEGLSGTAEGVIYDLSGREVWNGSWDASQSESVDLSAFNKGVYMLRVTLGGNSTVKKLVVK